MTFAYSGFQNLIEWRDFDIFRPNINLPIRAVGLADMTKQDITSDSFNGYVVHGGNGSVGGEHPHTNHHTQPEHRRYSKDERRLSKQGRLHKVSNKLFILDCFKGFVFSQENLDVENFLGC